jgi:hypothetical protein
MSRRGESGYPAGDATVNVISALSALRESLRNSKQIDCSKVFLNVARNGSPLEALKGLSGGLRVGCSSDGCVRYPWRSRACCFKYDRAGQVGMLGMSELSFLRCEGVVA